MRYVPWGRQHERFTAGKFDSSELKRNTTPSTCHYSIADKDMFRATARRST
jgi:hypothetical protein